MTASSPSLLNAALPASRLSTTNLDIAYPSCRLFCPFGGMHNRREPIPVRNSSAGPRFVHSHQDPRPKASGPRLEVPSPKPQAPKPRSPKEAPCALTFTVAALLRFWPGFSSAILYSGSRILRSSTWLASLAEWKIQAGGLSSVSPYQPSMGMDGDFWPSNPLPGSRRDRESNRTLDVPS